MKAFLVLVISLAGKPPDAILTNTFDSLRQCEMVKTLSPNIAGKLVGTRKTDGTLVTGVSKVCVEGTAGETRKTIEARALKKRP